MIEKILQNNFVTDGYVEKPIVSILENTAGSKSQAEKQCVQFLHKFNVAGFQPIACKPNHIASNRTSFNHFQIIETGHLWVFTGKYLDV